MIEIRKTIILRPRRRLSSRARIGAFSTRSNASSRREHRMRTRVRASTKSVFFLIDYGTPRLIDSGGANGGFPSVDAPLQARENVGVVVARGRMLSSVRPLMR